MRYVVRSLIFCRNRILYLEGARTSDTEKELRELYRNNQIDALFLIEKVCNRRKKLNFFSF